MRLTVITSALLLLLAAGVVATRGGGAPAADLHTAPAQAAKPKWEWWRGGAQLRGANIWLKRVSRSDGLGTSVVGPPYTRGDFKALKSWGANYVNISYPGIYGEEPGAGGAYALDVPVLDELKSLIADAGREGLFVVVSFRTGPRRSEAEVFVEGKLSRLWGDPEAQRGWEEMWRKAAQELKGYSHVVGYDLMVEPEIKVDRAAEWDAFAHRLIGAVRGAGDAETPVLVGGTGMSDVEGLEKLNVGVIDPAGDAKVVYTVHQYEPNDYAQQTEGRWEFDCKTGADLRKEGERRSRPDRGEYVPYNVSAFVKSHYQRIADWQKRHRDARGAPPVAVNEFGVVRWAGSMRKSDGHLFLGDQVKEMESHGFNHAIWKWDPAFCLGDDDYNFRHGPKFSNHTDVERDNPLAVAIKGFWSKNSPAAAPAVSSQKGAPASSPVAVNGQLKVCGTQLCNRHGKPIQLRGMSTHGLQWHGWGKCLTQGSLDALAGEWGADVARVSMYVQEDGYGSDPPGFTAQAERVVGELIARGLYVVIDWHVHEPGDPFDNLDAAKVYFRHMSKRFGDTPNVFYEIANEPNGGHRGRRVDWARIKRYAEQVNAVIRANDPDGVIIVGTPDWSSFGVAGGSGPSEVYGNPLGGANVMYSFHFYAAEPSHRERYARALEEASGRLPVFVTEWGTQLATGDGPNDFASAQRFVDLMARKKISWTNWNYSHDPLTGAVFNPGTCPNGPWSGGVLKEAGAWVRERILQPADDFPVR